MALSSLSSLLSALDSFRHRSVHPWVTAKAHRWSREQSLTLAPIPSFEIWFPARPHWQNTHRMTRCPCRVEQTMKTTITHVIQVSRIFSSPAQINVKFAIFEVRIRSTIPMPMQIPKSMRSRKGRGLATGYLILNRLRYDTMPTGTSLESEPHFTNRTYTNGGIESRGSYIGSAWSNVCRYVSRCLTR
jgi:hypothetical protein